MAAVLSCAEVAIPIQKKIFLLIWIYWGSKPGALQNIWSMRSVLSARAM